MDQTTGGLCLHGIAIPCGGDVDAMQEMTIPTVILNFIMNKPLKNKNLSRIERNITFKRVEFETKYLNISLMPRFTRLLL